MTRNVGDGKIGTFLLTKNKYCDSGLFEFDFMLTSKEGVIGAIFRYVSNLSYYMVEFSSNLIKIRKRTESGANIVERTRAWTMTKDKWYSAKLDFKDNELIVYA